MTQRALALAVVDETCSNREVEERSRRIVATAVELAEKGGFEAVRLRDVASHSGVALGTLYRRFRSKEDLLLAALEIEMEELERRIAQKPPRGETTESRVLSFFTIVTRALCRRPNLARALLRSVASGEPELTSRVAAFHTRMSELITQALRGPKAERSGIPPSDQERELAFSMQMVWFASLVGWAGGLHGQAGIIDQTHTAAVLMLRGAAYGSAS
jgi:AcrR family transcriptional regulator